VCIGFSFHYAQRDNETFLSAATLPSLVGLAIQLDEAMVPHLEGLLHRSNCRLTFLHSIGNIYDEDYESQKYSALVHKVGQRLGVPEVRYDALFEDSKMVREMRAEWYEWDYAIEVEDVDE